MDLWLLFDCVVQVQMGDFIIVDIDGSLGVDFHGYKSK
jgi:hypothetical protein